jgi:Ferritin-like domain
MADETIQFTLDELDRDGAIGEAAEAVTTDTRAGFLRKAGGAGAVILGGSAFMGALPKLAQAATIPSSDVAILNFALTLEYLESAFYSEAVANGKLTDPRTVRFAKVVANHEHSHVLFLQNVLGAKAVAKPKFDFKGTTSDQAQFQQTADTLENTGVHAYLGQVGNIKNKKILAAAGSILPVEARHAAWIRDINGKFTGQAPLPAPAAFQGAKTKAQILAAVKGTGFIVG